VCCITAAEQLPQIDQSVDSVAGLITLYQLVLQKHYTMPNNQRTGINRPWRRNYWHNISILNARQMHAVIKWGIGMNCAWPSGALLFKTIEVQLEECTEPVVAAAQDIWHWQQRGHHSAGYTAWTSCTGDTDSISRSDGPWTEHRTVATSERVWSFTRAQMWFVPRMSGQVSELCQIDAAGRLSEKSAFRHSNTDVL